MNRDSEEVIKRAVRKYFISFFFMKNLGFGLFFFLDFLIFI